MASKKYQELLGQAYRTTGGQGAVFSHDEQGNTYVDQYAGNGRHERVAYTPPTWEEGDTALHWRDEEDDGQQHSSKYLELMDAARELTGGTGTAFNSKTEDDELLRQTAKEAADAEAKRKEEAEGYKKKGVLGRIWDVIRGIDTRAGNAFLSNVSGAAASIAGKDTLVSDVQAAAKLIADKDDGVSVGQALKRLDQQAGNRVVAAASGAAERIWDSIGGVINRFGGNVDTENDIFSRWNQNRQAVKAASTEALYGPDGIQNNAVSDWNERRVAVQQQYDEMYQNRYSESPVAQTVSKYGTMAWSQAPSAMLAVMMTVANPAAGGEMIANGLAPATTKGLGYIAALENSSGMKKLAMLAGNTIGNLAKDPQFWYSYSQEAGGAYNEAIQEGADPSTASLYASVYGALSGAIEIQGVFEGGNLEKLPGNIKKALLRGDKAKAAWLYVESILGEIGEEEAQDMVSKLLKTSYRDDIPLYSTDNEDAIINPRSMLETAKDTAITTALMGAGERVVMGASQKVIDTRHYRGDASLLIEQAKQAGGEQSAEAIAKIEKAAESGGLNMGQARELYQIIRDNGGEEAYNEAAKAKNRQQIVGAAVDAAFEGTNLDAKGRETLVNDFTPGETKLSEYIQGVKEAYSLGQKNTTLTQATQSAKRAGVLTAEQFRHAWQLGRGEVTTETNTADVKTEEGKTRLTSELKVMGKHAEAAAAVYNEDQDVSRFAAAMNTAANLYAAQGEKVKDFVAAVREGKAASEIGYLTDQQLATAYQIGEALRQERQDAVKKSAARFETIRAKAQQITAQAASAAQIDTAITEARNFARSEQQEADRLQKEADDLMAMWELPENGEELWNAATAGAKEHRQNAEKAQETVKELEAKRKEIPATESAETRGRATLASEAGTVNAPDGGSVKYEAVNEAELSRQQRTIVEAVGIIAEELGLDVTIIKARGDMGGVYLGGGKILLNIYSGMNLKGFSKAIAAGSFSHEMTHWLQEYASEEYDELKQYIRDSMGSEKYDALVKQEQRAQPGLSYEKAEDEVVANACQPMLQNSKAFEQFAREHRNVAEKIRDFLKEFRDKIKAAFAEVDFQDNIPIYNAVKAVENELEGMQEIFDRALVRARENLQAERTASNQAETRQETGREQAENAAQLQSWGDMTEDEQRAEINATMTMEQAKKMIQKAFIAGEIRDWYDEYHNGEEWLRGQGAADVAEVIENDSQLYMQYIGRNPHLTEYDFTMEEVIEAYLAGTLTGPVKAKAKRVDVTTGRGVKDSRFYSNTQGEPVTVKTWDLANSRATKSNQAAVNKARKDILLAAHNGDVARELGITDAELNKKLRSWSRYSAKARDASIRINAGVAPENRWTGIQNSSILAHIDMTDEDILSMVKSITGESEQYQRNYIGATMLALDTHINWSMLDFEFKRGNADPTDPKVLGYYTNDTRRIVVGGRGDMNTVAHEMGHALDYLWERELFAGKSSQPLTENTFDIDKIPDEDGRTFYKNFRTFMDNLMESGAIHSSYWMEQKETFARFVARFVEWTQEIAGSSYVRGEGLKFGDKFTTAQYLEFAKLLQEKAAWDAKRAAETGVQFQSWSMEEYEEYTKDFDEDGAYAAKREQEEEKRSIDAQIRERKPEENDWIDRVVKGEATPEQYEEWLKESGLDKLYERQREAEKHVEMLERRNRELVDSRLESEERAAIEKSGLTEAEYFRKEAVKEFGYTPHFYDAGYILPNGKMLNFSGIKGKHTGRRAQDHRAIGTIFATTKGSDGMYRFVNDGNIRIMAEAPGLDISAEHEPTPEQYRQIKSFVRESRDEGYFAVDFTDATGRNTGSMEYDEDSRISADRIVRDIKYYYQTGEVPETQRYQFQRWDDTTDDTAAESNGRNLAYTRLQSENKILKDTVKALNKLTGKQSTTIEKLQERLRLNKTPEVREDDAKKMARSLLREYGSKADSEAVARQLKEIGDYILQTSTDKVNEEEIKSRARAVAAEIIDAASEQISVDGEYMAEIVSSIRGKKLTIDDAFLGELDQAGGFEAFRRRNFGKFTLAKRSGSYDASQYMSVSQFYTDLQNNYGKSYFPDAANEGEEIIRIADAFDLARPMEVNPFEQYMGEAVEDLANRIAMDTMGGVLRAEPVKYADVEYRREKSRNEELNERIKQLEAENALTHEEAGRLWNQVSDLTTKLDLAETQYAALQKSAEARLEQVRAEGRERETEIKAREREKAARDMKALKEYYRRKAKSQREMRENAARSTKYRAEIERKARKLRDMLLTNSDKLHVPEVLKAPLADFLAGIDMSSKSLLNYDIATQKDQKFHASFGRLLNALSGQQEYFSGTGEVQADMGGYIDISNDNMEFLRRMTEVVAGWMETGETYTINRMNTQQLHDLSNLLTNLTQAIKNLNNFMANARYETVGEAAKGDITRMEELGRASEAENSALYTAAAWENGTPYYVFKRLGEGARAIFDGLTRGWEKMAFNVQEVIGFTEGLYSTKEVTEWKSAQHEITLEDGHKITMTTAQIMELSMLLEREQALKHIEHGGIRVGDIETRKGRKHDTRHYHLTEKDIAKITGLLNERQRFVAKALRNYMASKGSEWGNEISLRRFGYKFYTEGEGYYPIKTDANDRPMADTDAQVNSMFRLLNLSSSKTLNPRASNALIVGDIFETFSDHMADMAKLNGLGLPLLDAIKYFNYKERVDRGDGTYDTVTVQGAMEQAFGSAAQRYYRTLIKDINGVTENGDRGTAIYNKFMSNYKAAAVAANLRVAFLQPTSYVRASFLIKPQYLAGVLPSKAAYAEARKWSGTVNWKEIGGVDTNLARGMRDQIERDGGWKEKLVEKSMILAELGDKITWSRLWTACKRQTKAENRNLSGDELNRATADLFREVIYGTQVMDSTLTRSELMRGRSNATKAMTAFMAEPTLSYNLLFDAVFNAHYDQRKNGKGAWARNSGKIGKAATVYVCSAAWSAVVESVFDAMRDDDDFESFMQKWAQAMFGESGKWWTGNLAQDMTILGKLPYFKNFISTLQGFTSGDMSMTAFNNAVNAAAIWKETYELSAGTLDKATKVTYYGNMTTWGKVYKTLQALSQLSGIAVANLTRDATALWNTAMSLAGHEEKKIKTYDPGQQKSVKNAFLSGAMSEEEAIEKLVESGEAKTQDAAYWTVRGWDGEDKYSEIKAAAFAGDSETFKAEMQQANEHGIKEKEVYSSIKSLIKKVYMGEELEEGDLKIVGDTTLTDEQARRMLKTYGGMSVDDAVKTVNGWKETRTFVQQHGGEYEQYGLTVAQAQYYYSTAKGSVRLQDYAEQVEKYGMDRVKAYYGADGWGKTGLSIAQYDTYYTKAAACKGTDANGDGKTDSGSKKAQVMQVINSLPVSNAVKDALYIKNGWSERTINEAPWRH